jgi:hypothetical protein
MEKKKLQTLNDGTGRPVWLATFLTAGLCVEQNRLCHSPRHMSIIAADTILAGNTVQVLNTISLIFLFLKPRACSTKHVYSR